MVSTTSTDIADLIRLTVRAAEAYGRRDLAARARARLDDLDDQTCQVVVTGEFKQGKSSLVNGLLGVDVCPVDDDIATAVPTLIKHGDSVGVTAVFGHRDSDDLSPADFVRKAVPATDLTKLILETGDGRSYIEPSDGDLELIGVEVELPRRMLSDGLELFDTPGLGGLTSRHGAMTAMVLSEADAVVFVTDASQELTAAEAEFLEGAIRRCPSMIIAMPKIDIHPSWREIVDLNRAHLAILGHELSIVPVSSTLREAAVASSNRDLSAESGFPVLVAWLEELRRQTATGAAQRVRDDMLDVIDQLGGAFRSELAALTGGGNGDTRALLADLEVARSTAEALQQGSATWQTVLSDGMADLVSDVDHDLRDRLRGITTEAQQRAESGDPARRWEEHEKWLQAAVSTELLANHDLLMEQSEQLADRIAELFRAASGAQSAPVGSAAHAVPAVVRRPQVSRGGVRTLLGGMRGGYGGILMFGALASIAGFAITAPVMIAIGAVMGGKGVKDERDRELASRRQRAFTSMRTYVDEVGFRAGKHSRDTLRQIQRVLRDHYRDQAAELQATATQSLAAARQAVEADVPQRDRRRRDVESEIERLDQLESMWASPIWEHR